MEIYPIPAFIDNYIWALKSSDSSSVWVEDPVDAVPVLNHPAANELELKGILITHHHLDHIGA